MSPTRTVSDKFVAKTAPICIRQKFATSADCLSFSEIPTVAYWFFLPSDGSQCRIIPTWSEVGDHGRNAVMGCPKYTGPYTV